jgi:hypothetical protein
MKLATCILPIDATFHQNVHATSTILSVPPAVTGATAQ